MPCILPPYPDHHLQDLHYALMYMLPSMHNPFDFCFDSMLQVAGASHAAAATSGLATLCGRGTESI
jgi:hypothetical protein